MQVYNPDNMLESEENVRFKVIPLFVFIGMFNFYPGKSFQFTELNGGRFPGSLAFGNAYPVYANGAETLHYNSSGIVDLSIYTAVYSRGTGSAIFATDVSAHDIAFIIPTFYKIEKAYLLYRKTILTYPTMPSIIINSCTISILRHFFHSRYKLIQV